MAGSPPPLSSGLGLGPSSSPSPSSGDPSHQASSGVVLALPGPEYGRLNFENGDLQVCEKRIYVVEEGGKGRGTAWDVWDGAWRLAKWLEKAAEQDALKFELPSLASDAPTKVNAPPLAIELGSGTGLGGMAIRAAFPEADVHLTDLPEVMEALNANVHRNHHLLRSHGHVRLKAMPLDWTTTLTGTLPLHIAPHGYDLVVAADCVWLIELIPAFVRTLRAVTHQRSLVVLAYQERSRAATRALFGTLDAHFTREDADGFLARLDDAAHGRPPSDDASAAVDSKVRIYLLRRLSDHSSEVERQKRDMKLSSIDRALIEEGCTW
ncbi:lysine methyltransferase [Pycnococcus provasolii]